MKATIKAEYLKELINIAYACSNEIRLDISLDKISFSVVDIANVMLLHMDIKTSAFERRVSGEDMVACIDVSRIRGFMGVFKGFIELEIDDSYITLNNLKYTFKDNLLKCSDVKKSPKNPEIELKSKSIVKVSDFRTFVKVYKKEFKEIYMSTNDCFFESCNNPSDLNRMSYTECNGSIKQECMVSHFSTDYIIAALSAIKGDAEIELNNDHPCKISFKAMDDYASGFFFIAPRIEAD